MIGPLDSVVFVYSFLESCFSQFPSFKKKNHPFVWMIKKRQRLRKLFFIKILYQIFKFTSSHHSIQLSDCQNRSLKHSSKTLRILPFSPLFLIFELSNLISGLIDSLSFSNIVVTYRFITYPAYPPSPYPHHHLYY